MLAFACFSITKKLTSEYISSNQNDMLGAITPPTFQSLLHKMGPLG